MAAARASDRIAFSQDALRRAGYAMAESGMLPPGTDVFKLARIALEAAVRDRDDLEELIGDK